LPELLSELRSLKAPVEVELAAARAEVRVLVLAALVPEQVVPEQVVLVRVALPAAPGLLVLPVLLAVLVRAAAHSHAPKRGGQDRAAEAAQRVRSQPAQMWRDLRRCHLILDVPAVSAESHRTDMNSGC
jgi:hypothetical protein